MGDSPGESDGGSVRTCVAARGAQASPASSESSAPCFGACGWSPCRSRCKFFARPAS